MSEHSHPGQPTKYDPKYIQEVNKYLIEIQEDGKKLPTLAGFAIRLGVDVDTVTAWRDARKKDEEGNKTKKRLNPEFFRALKRLESYQQEQLINDGMYSRNMPTTVMAIFLLKANHKMVETTNLDHTTKGKELPTPILGGITDVSKDNSNK